MSRELARGLVRHSRLVVLAIAVVMCLSGTFHIGLWTPDEPREAEIGREMWLSRWSPMPTLGGEAFLEKPPLFPWVMAAFYALFGVSPGIARLAAALFGIGSMLVAHEMGKRAGGRAAGLFSAVVLATSVKFTEVSHSAINDNALTFFVAAGHLSFSIARDRHRSGGKSWWFVAHGACAGLAFLTKSIIGPVLVAGPPLVATALLGEWRFVRAAFVRSAAWCALFVVAIGLPWVLALAHTGGWSAVRVCLIDNTLGRSVHASPEFGHEAGPLYYIGTFPLEALPWILVLPALLASRTLERSWRGGRARVCALIVIAGLAILSLPATKRGLYALPLYPAASVAAGVWLSRAGSVRGSRFDRITLACLASIAALILVAASGALLWFAWGAGAPNAIEHWLVELRDLHGLNAGDAPVVRWRWTVLALLAGAAGVLAIASVVRSRRAAVAALARSTVLAIGAALLVWLCALKPFVDPIKGIGESTRAAMSDVPASEPLLGLGLDETTRAVIPFYTQRFIRSVPTSAQAIDVLSEGSARHLVVMANAEQLIDPALRAHLHQVSQKKLSANRVLNVYRFDGRH
jgi:4-amino-4-deoxy-L-arabinose transferase-like glycosyltransferase